MSNFSEKFKKIFPPPILPQKRYLILVICLIIYLALKAYTVYTPDKSDDKWPDEFKNAVVFVVQSESESDSDSDQDIFPTNAK